MPQTKSLTQFKRYSDVVRVHHIKRKQLEMCGFIRKFSEMLCARIFKNTLTWIIHFNDKMIKMTVIFNKKIL